MAPLSPERDRRPTWLYCAQGSEAFRGDLYFHSVDHDLRGRLGETGGERCPVIMLTGDFDYLPAPEDGRRTAGKIRGAEFMEIKGIGHFPTSENYRSSGSTSSRPAEEREQTGRQSLKSATSSG